MNKVDRRLVDTHHFTIWRFEDDSVDINCVREDCAVDYHNAYMEASVLTRSLGEEMHGTDEMFSLHVYQNGLVSSHTRHELGFVQHRQQFMWVCERVHEAKYNGIVGLRPPPMILMRALWRLEYWLGRAAQLLRGKPVRSTTAVELEAGPPPPLPDLGPNVVRLQPRRHPPAL